MTGTNTGITLQLARWHLNQNILYIKLEQVNRHYVADTPYCKVLAITFIKGHRHVLTRLKFFLTW